MNTSTYMASDFTKRSIEIEPALASTKDSSEGDLPEIQTGDSGASGTKMEKYNLEYDKLVITAGCYSASFGIPGVSRPSLVWTLAEFSG